MSHPASTLPIAVQLYSLRTLSGGIDEILSTVSAAGYTAVETVGDHGLSASELGDLLAKYGLRVISTHVQLDALAERTSEIVAFNKALGNTTLVVPFIAALLNATGPEIYREIGAQLGELATRVRGEGMQLLYHNHNWEMKEFEGKRAIDILFESAGADLGFEPDLAWITAGGADPIELLQRYAGRSPRAHIKDLAPAGERPEDALGGGVVLADVGHGTIDWPTLLPAAQAAGVEWYIVEHDNPRDPGASVTRSIQYLRGQLGSLLNGE